MIYEKKLVELFEKKTVITFKEVSKVIKCSYKTFVRFLGRHGFYSSINKNGKYYILAKECEFDQNGLFFLNDIMFSSYRTLKNSVLSFIDKSEQGVTTANVTAVFGSSSTTALSNLYTGKEISRQMYHGTFYYFSSDTEAGLHQRESRKQLEAGKADKVPVAEEQLPSAQVIIAVLTAAVIKSGASAKQIRESLKKQGLNIPSWEIKSILRHYKIPEKKT